MEKEMKKTGIDVLGDAPWGSHFCQFYKTKEDLTNILVPYFKAGLENNEFCMWVTSEPLNQIEAKKAMRMAVPNFDQYLKRGQIEFVPKDEWYLEEGAFNIQRVLNAWIEKLNQALAQGYDGIRTTGNAAWLEENYWKKFAEYEEEMNNTIGKYKMLAICSYSLDKCGALEVVDVVSNHQLALIRLGGKWEAIENSEHKKTEEALRRTYNDLEMQIKKRTIELTKANLLLKKEITERKRADEKIKQSLREKELLLSEIHHRVKNNLQIISSLLDMSSMRIHDQKTLDLFKAVHSRVHTMALIHSQLHRTSQFDKVEMGSYIHEQMKYLSQAFATMKGIITPIIDHDEVCLSINQAIPCALVLNEVVSNAFKHAFKGRKKGTIEISLKKSARDTVFIRVKDDGVGIPEEIDINKTDSLGLKLVRNLVQEQLKGKLQVTQVNGTEIIIEFKTSKKEKKHE